MHQLAAAIRRMIAISGEEMEGLLRPCFTKTFKKQEELSRPGPVPNDIFFINRGILQVIVVDKNGTEHTVHFAMENQFIADYSSFMLRQPALYTLRALEETETVVVPRSAIGWG